MPRPRPSAVVRLIAKTDTSVTLPRTKSSANVPTIAISPMTSGSIAARRLPKARTSSRSVTGTAIASATARSPETWALTSMLTALSPPARTWTPSRSPV